MFFAEFLKFPHADYYSIIAPYSSITTFVVWDSRYQAASYDIPSLKIEAASLTLHLSCYRASYLMS
jgi:hypothetical protein